jgi:hypothetical protein
MTRSVSTSSALLCALALFAPLVFISCRSQQTGVNSNGTGTATPKSTLAVDCNAGSTTNDQIVKAIYDALSPNYSKEFDQFNITASKPDVKIVGWSTNKTQIVQLAQGAATGCVIKDSQFANSEAGLSANYQQRIGCPPGTGPCGDICIPVGEPCKVTSDTVKPPNWDCTAVPSPTPTPTP